LVKTNAEHAGGLISSALTGIDSTPTFEGLMSMLAAKAVITLIMTNAINPNKKI
jgi:hypothetical protein